jgi:hypothetical protein
MDIFRLDLRKYTCTCQFHDANFTGLFSRSVTDRISGGQRDHIVSILEVKILDLALVLYGAVLAHFSQFRYSSGYRSRSLSEVNIFHGVEA